MSDCVMEQTKEPKMFFSDVNTPFNLTELAQLMCGLQHRMCWVLSPFVLILTRLFSEVCLIQEDRHTQLTIKTEFCQFYKRWTELKHNIIFKYFSTYDDLRPLIFPVLLNISLSQ